MSKPTIEEYKRAKECISMISVAMAESNERILDLVDELTSEKTMLDTYIQALEYNKKVVWTYETCEEELIET